MSSSPALAIARLAALVLLSAALISASTLHSSSESSESSSAAASDLPRSSLGPGDYVFTLNRPEGPRTFRVRVPKSYAPAAPTPLLLAFHGLNDHCDKFDLKTGFLQLADQYGFLLVYPCSETGALGTAWNAGTCCLGNATVDDNAFARGIVSFMQASFAVDSSRVWSSGFSNGAMMTESLACNSSDIFTAVASVSGCTELQPGNAGGLALCDKNFAAKSRTIPIVHVHGDLDLIVPWTGDALLGFPTTPDDMQRWATRNGCGTQTKQTLNSGTFTNQVWQGCAKDTHVELVRNAGGTHKWIRSADFDTSVHIIEFMFKFGRRV